ncbi:MAG: hypothetical protein RJP95_03380 [Pirellulales bacterium]
MRAVPELEAYHASAYEFHLQIDVDWIGCYFVSEFETDFLSTMYHPHSKVMVPIIYLVSCRKIVGGIEGGVESTSLQKVHALE